MPPTRLARRIAGCRKRDGASGPSRHLLLGRWRLGRPLRDERSRLTEILHTSQRLSLILDDPRLDDVHTAQKLVTCLADSYRHPLELGQQFIAKRSGNVATQHDSQSIAHRRL